MDNGTLEVGPGTRATYVYNNRVQNSETREQRKKTLHKRVGKEGGQLQGRRRSNLESERRVHTQFPRAI
jgi:hypothetical protein